MIGSGRSTSSFQPLQKVVPSPGVGAVVLMSILNSGSTSPSE